MEKTPQWDGVWLLPAQHPPAIPQAAQLGRGHTLPPKISCQPGHEVLCQGKLSLELRGQGDLTAK